MRGAPVLILEHCKPPIYAQFIANAEVQKQRRQSDVLLPPQRPVV
jgi:hypothetical protein